MLNRKAAVLYAVIAAGAVSFQARAEDDTVNLYNWGNYFGSTVLQDFAKETGIKANWDVYDSEEAADTKLMVGHSGYDVVIMTAEPFLHNQIKAGVYRKINATEIPALKTLDPQLMKIVTIADPHNAHAAIYLWGTIGLGYNVDAVKKRLPGVPVDSWDLLFKPEYAAKLADCGIGLPDSAAIVLPIALKYLGYSPNSTKKEELEKAADLLLKVRPYIKYFNSNTLVADMANKDICFDIDWSGDAIQAANQAKANKTGANIDYAVPKEGAPVFFDVLAVPADAPHPEAAFKFINFLLQPKPIAESSNELAYGNAVPASTPYLTHEVANDPRIFPPEDVKKRLFLVSAQPAETQRLITRLWTKVKAGQ
jgi:putrescine transport system substrate-binding protein